MKTASVREAQHHLSRLLAEVEAGEEIILTRRGEQVAKLVPMPRNEGPADVERRRQWLLELEELRKTSGGDPNAENTVLQMREEERY